MTTLNEKSGTISDGSGDGNYINYAYCQWLIEADENEQIILEFTEFDTEDRLDRVKVYDGDHYNNAEQIANFSGDNLPEPVISSSNKMFILFDTNSTENRSGWSANYRTTSTLSNKTKPLNKIRVYPNPTNTFLNIDTKQEVKIKMYSILGKLIFQLNKETNEIKTIDTSSLKKGVYLLEIENDKSKICKRIVKN